MKNLTNYIVIAIIAGFMFIPFLGHVHLFDWDEINFAESAREMIVSGDYSRVMVNFQPFWEKPPLFIWLQAISMHIFGVNEFAARFPNAIIGIITLLTVFTIGAQIFDQRFGWLWVLTFAGAFLPALYFKSGIIDPYFNLFIFAGVYYLMLITKKDVFPYQAKGKFAILAGVFIGLGILTKGPVALLIAIVCLLLYWVWEKFYPVIKIGHLFLFFLFAGLLSLFWFGLETIKHGPWFIQEFFVYQVRLLTTADAGHSGPFYYHFVVLLIGCFPASIFVLKSFSPNFSDNYDQRHMKRWMIVILVVVLLIFSIVKTKIVHYSSLAYFPITFLAAYTIYHKVFQKNLKLNMFIYVLLLFIGIVFAVAFAVAPLVGMNPEMIIPYINDPVAVASLQAEVSWFGYESLIGLFYFFMVIISVLKIRSRTTSIMGYVLLFVSSAITLQLVLLFIVPKVEAYAQRTPIEFYKSLQGQDVYVETLGFKSYAHLFYTRRPEPENPLSQDGHWLRTGEVDKPVFFVSKIDKAQGFAERYNLEVLYEKNGFVFLTRAEPLPEIEEIEIPDEEELEERVSQPQFQTEE